MELIKVEDLHIKLTKEFYTLFNINFSLNKGEKLLIIANKDSGKTMLLRAICGLEELDKGSVVIAGSNVNDCIKEGKIQMGFLPTYPIFLDTKSVRQNLLFVLKNRKVDKTLTETKIADVIKRFKLESIENKCIYTLSYFEKLMVAIARLALRDLDILVLDTFNTNLEQNQIDEIEKNLEGVFYSDADLTIIKACENVPKISTKFKLARMNSGSLEI